MRSDFRKNVLPIVADPVTIVMTAITFKLIMAIVIMSVT